ncbi:MAG: hypothetical protein AAGC60_22735 [Acidobacteriota bacterium]
MKDRLPNLTGRDELREVLYHLFDILEIQEATRGLLELLDRAYLRDPEATADLLNELEIQVTDHLGYHVREIKSPLRRLVTTAFNALEAEAQDDKPTSA